ncbi:MAG: hypothetical protein RLZZ436_128, partial [Planctomycetota bacterium]
PQAAARRLILVWHRVCGNDERAGGSPRLRFGTLVRAPARGASSALPGLFTRRLPPGGSCVFGIAFAEILSGRAEAPGCDSHPGAHPCPRRQRRVAGALYPQAAARRLIRVWHRVCGNDERSGGSPRLRFRTLVRAPARGVSSAVPGHFTRRLPPGGSCVFGIAFAEILSGRAEAPGCDSAPWCPRGPRY